MSKLKSHAPSPKEVAHVVSEKTAKIIKSGNKPHVTIQQQIDILNQLEGFPFGRFLLQHQGTNGYWTHYMLTHPWEKNNIHLSKLENFLLTSISIRNGKMAIIHQILKIKDCLNYTHYMLLETIQNIRRMK